VNASYLFVQLQLISLPKADKTLSCQSGYAMSDLLFRQYICEVKRMITWMKGIIIWNQSYSYIIASWKLRTLLVIIVRGGHGNSLASLGGRNPVEAGIACLILALVEAVRCQSLISKAYWKRIDASKHKMR
jgi:hypothetical protein